MVCVALVHSTDIGGRNHWVRAEARSDFLCRPEHGPGSAGRVTKTAGGQVHCWRRTKSECTSTAQGVSKDGRALVRGKQQRPNGDRILPCSTALACSTFPQDQTISTILKLATVRQSAKISRLDDTRSTVMRRSSLPDNGPVAAVVDHDPSSVTSPSSSFTTHSSRVRLSVNGCRPYSID